QTKMVSENNDKYCNFYSDVDVFKNGNASIDAGDEEKEIIPNESSFHLDYWLTKYHSNKNELSQAIQARVIEFVTGEHIFFPINSKVKVFNKVQKVVREKPINSIEENDWVVIKTSSDGDYIRQRAERIVGNSYQSMFYRVTKYKEQLLNYANRQDLSTKELKKVLQKNEIHVEEQLLNQWLFGDTIAPRKYREILEFLGYDIETINTLENEYRIILDAHKRAGRDLGRNIQTLIEKTETQQISEKMRKFYTFNFEIEKIGHFSIKEVSCIVDKKVKADINDLYKILN
ncbi:MAG: hypothetical protein L0L95_02930, partial [Staphylococcus equorum]|nr:hypothetical protein [Staphylococcus equorum]